VALFKCLRSGNTVEIFQEDDIDRMKDHEGYIRLDLHQGENHEVSSPENAKAQTDQDAKAEVTEADPKPVAKRGRPKKTEMEVVL
jgi:hypothetical protein